MDSNVCSEDRQVLIFKVKLPVIGVFCFKFSQDTITHSPFLENPMPGSPQSIHCRPKDVTDYDQTEGWYQPNFGKNIPIDHYQA